MIVTVLEATVPPGQEGALQSAYRDAAARARPSGLVRSELQRDARDPTRWRIQTWWSSREALDAMRRAGTPEGVLMFRAAGAEPTLALFETVEAIEEAQPR
jgi:heme-degrading monooxygenase HmoA